MKMMIKINENNIQLFLINLKQIYYIFLILNYQD